MTRTRLQHLASATLATVLGLSLTLSVTGCAIVDDVSFERAMKSELQPSEAVGYANVDFSSLVEGPWTQLVIVCNGASSDDLRAALGFDWTSSPDLNDSGFGSLLVFATDSEVVRSVQPGRNEFFVDLYFTPCTPAGHGDADAVPHSLSRQQASVEFTFDGSTYAHPLWFVSEDEASRLASLD